MIQNEKLRRLPHIIMGIVILLHSLERWETGHASYLVFLLAGVVFLGLAAFHHRLSVRFPIVDYVFYVIEGLLSFFIAWEYAHAGKQGLPFMYIFAGLMQFVALYTFSRKQKG